MLASSWLLPVPHRAPPCLQCPRRLQHLDHAAVLRVHARHLRPVRGVTRTLMTALPLALALAVLVVHAAAAGARHACTGASVNLSATQCDGWVALFDATNGTGWSECSAYRLDPCGCSEDTDDDGTVVDQREHHSG